jgi:hypothetical protein
MQRRKQAENLTGCTAHRLLPPFESMFRTSLVMTDDGNANAAGNFSEEKMIGKPFQVHAPSAFAFDVEAL